MIDPEVLFALAYFLTGIITLAIIGRDEIKAKVQGQAVSRYSQSIDEEDLGLEEVDIDDW